MMCKKILYGSNFLLVFFILSCTFYQVKEDSYVFIDESSVVESSMFFEFDVKSNSYIFETNDVQFSSSKGYTFWMTSEENEGASFKEFSATVYKESGREEAGHGIVFIAQEINGVQFLASVLINVKGMYIIGKVKDGVFERVCDWTDCNYIKKGFGVENKLSVSYSEEDKNFMLKINDAFIKMFSMDEDFKIEGSKSGYVVVLAHNENFPDNPVKVVFGK